MGTQASKLLNHGIGTGGLMQYFGTGGLGDVTISSDTTMGLSSTKGAIVLNYNNLTINSGVTLTTAYPCQGLVIFATGNVTINGTINMDKKGVNIAGELYPLPIFKGDFSKYGYLMSQITGLYGGAGGAGGSGGSIVSGYGGSGGSGGLGRVCAGGYGGGGGGAGAKSNWNTTTYSSGLAGGSWGGKREPDDQKFILGCSSSLYNNFRTYRYTGTMPSGFGGVAGNMDAEAYAIPPFGGYPYGGGGGGASARVGSETWCNGSDGEYAGGFVCIIAKGNITIGSTGKITANGGNGGNGASALGDTAYEGSVGGTGGGGGAGGGVVCIRYHGTYSNTGSITVNGGTGGSAGAKYVYSTETPTDGTSGSSGSVGTISVSKV